MKPLTLLLFILSAFITNQAFGEEYIVRLEDLMVENVDLQVVKNLQMGFPGVDEKKLKGRVVQGNEILVQSDSRFFYKSIVGKTTTTLRGELKSMSEPGRFQLDVRREVTESTGKFLRDPDGNPVDASPRTIGAINGPIELGKPIYLPRTDEKGAVILFSVRLETAKSVP